MLNVKNTSPKWQRICKKNYFSLHLSKCSSHFLLPIKANQAVCNTVIEQPMDNWPEQAQRKEQWREISISIKACTHTHTHRVGEPRKTLSLFPSMQKTESQVTSHTVLWKSICCFPDFFVFCLWHLTTINMQKIKKPGRGRYFFHSTVYHRTVYHIYAA